MTDKPLEDMSEEELSEFYYAHADTIEEHFADGTVDLRPAASLGVNTSVRFALDEHRAVRRAAEDAG
ncbi:hypothetical protein [Nocardiopsis trehalosi]|uniref:hypothetical protein n=1 Tax=Nocardiopsis trehalosi TaxID=109329 RepID=UPI000835CCF7|nr:hypothetical protein [Nocardiopsis trehalosi]